MSDETKPVSPLAAKPTAAAPKPTTKVVVEAKPTPRALLDQFSAGLPKDLGGLLDEVDFEGIAKQERVLAAAFRAFEGEKARLAEGQQDAAHNQVATNAGRALGKAHGGLVQAVEGLRVFHGTYEEALKRYAAVDKEPAK